jgi:hypothetical protein
MEKDLKNKDLLLKKPLIQKKVKIMFQEVKLNL